MSNFHRRKVAGRGSGTQIEVGGDLNSTTYSTLRVYVDVEKRGNVASSQPPRTGKEGAMWHHPHHLGLERKGQCGTIPTT